MPIGFRRAPRRQNQQTDNDHIDFYLVNIRREIGSKPYLSDESELYQEAHEQAIKDNKKKDEEIHS